jgi:hypothetical protein
MPGPDDACGPPRGASGSLNDKNPALNYTAYRAELLSESFHSPLLIPYLSSLSNRRNRSPSLFFLDLGGAFHAETVDARASVRYYSLASTLRRKFYYDVQNNALEPCIVLHSTDVIRPTSSAG